ncbi:MAG: hypothetical protein L6Q37_05390 [Bdellovibrionaceae bacterium]|nr:hypothetical protein [Pseudobdellovibrionaceae bacterium]NUM58579.1 hypothetical protein [Pseudobdellovibrionaceae bacterium]
MKKWLLASVFIGSVVFAEQIVVNVPTEDFGPMKSAQWQLSVSQSSIAVDQSNLSMSATGLSLAAQRKVWDNLSLGAQFGVLKSNTTEYYYQGEVQTNYREAIVSSMAYAKYAFINYPLNRWNQIQVSALGGVSHIQKMQEGFDAIYGASISYNYDNLIGFEVDSKINTKAEALTSAGFVGYF